MQYTQLSRRSAGGKIDWEKQYLTFIPVENATFSFSKRGTGNDIEYSIDGGAWTSLASKANTPTVGAGHNIRWRAEIVPSTTSGSQGIGTFSASGLYDAMGNTMSLLYGDNYIGQTTLVGSGWTFGRLWLNDTHIRKCDKMVLPATSMVNYGYCYMFQGCTSLITAPELPAISLSVQCYALMFDNCLSLIIAPVLPALTLQGYCYRYMFNNCKKLNLIKMLATNIATTGLTNWLTNVSATGTFIKNAAMTTLPTGTSGIPSGWTVVDDNI